jgi:hypothetical protein
VCTDVCWHLEQFLIIVTFYCGQIFRARWSTETLFYVITMARNNGEILLLLCHWTENRTLDSLLSYIKR